MTVMTVDIIFAFCVGFLSGAMFWIFYGYLIERCGHADEVRVYLNGDSKTMPVGLKWRRCASKRDPRCSGVHCTEHCQSLCGDRCVKP